MSVKEEVALPTRASVPTLFEGPKDEYRTPEGGETDFLLIMALEGPMQMTATELAAYFTENGAPFAVMVLAKRFALVQDQTMKFDPATIIWAAAQCERPGDAVMWAYTIVHTTRERGLSCLSLKDWLLVDRGIPTRKLYDRVWDSQKIGGGNWLDRQDAYN